MEENKPKSSSGCGKVAIGCGIAVLIVIILLAMGGWYVANNWRSWTAKGLSSAVTKAVDQSTLPADQKKAITDRVDHVMQEFADGNITVEQISKAAQALEVEKLIMAGMAQYVGSTIKISTKLSDEERAHGEQALNRIAHGVLDGQINQSQIEPVFKHIMEDDGSGNWSFKQSPSADDINAVIKDATELADQAGVAQDVGQIDYAKRVEQAFDQALGISE